jgi:hypothetical protein
MQTTWRLGLALVLLILVLASGVHYDAREERHRTQPTADQVVADYDRHVGDTTLLFGTVETIDRGDGTATIGVEASTSIQIQVQGFDADVSRGGTVQVYGTLRPDRKMEADSIVVVNQDPASRYYKYAVSALGALVILAVFFRHWRIDWSNVGFVPRGEDDG